MKNLSKVALALAGVAGLALSAESAQAQLVLNGTGSSAGRLFAGNSPAQVCAPAPTPLLFVSSEGTPNKYEWQCTVNGVANSRIRYSATNSSDGFEKQPNGAVGTAVFLNTAGCPAGVPTVILGVNVLRSVCPAATPTQSLTVHWGGSDVKASSLHQTAGGVVQVPPAAGHLTTAPTVIVPFAIVVGGQVRNGSGGTLVTMTADEIRQILSGNVTSWTDLGYDTTVANKVITVCQRQGGSGTIAALDETIMLPKYWGISPFSGVSNASSSNMVACVNNNGTAQCVFTPGNAGTECRASGGDCDVADVCDGTRSTTILQPVPLGNPESNSSPTQETPVRQQVVTPIVPSIQPESNPIPTKKP